MKSLLEETTALCTVANSMYPKKSPNNCKEPIKGERCHEYISLRGLVFHDIAALRVDGKCVSHAWELWRPLEP